MADHLVLRGGAVPGPTGWIADCDVELAHGRVAAVGTQLAASGATAIDARGQLVAPGFIDVHVHGAGGAMFEDGHEDGVERICAALPQFGTTGIAATIAALPPDRLRQAVQAIARAASRVSGARILGIHLEGPFLNPQRAGAQQAAWMRAPSPAELESLQACSGGMIRLLTLAPELPGSLELIAAARSLDIAVALGHSQASEEQTLAAIDAGARHVTHLFNAAAPLHHRAPGLVGTALTDDRLSVELIADGIHLHRRAIDIALRCKPPDKVVLVSDGVAAIGMPDGEIEMFGVRCVARDAVRVQATGQLAGSRLTLDRALRNMRGWFPAEKLEQLLTWASTAPAALLALREGHGTIAAGCAADLVVLTPQLDVIHTLVGGRSVHHA